MSLRKGWKIKSMHESQAEGSAPYSSFWWLLSREWHDDDGAGDGCICTQGRGHMREGRSVSGWTQRAFAVRKAENLELVVRQTVFKS